MLLWVYSARAQSVQANAGFLVKAELTLGNQRQGVKIGTYGIGSVHYGDFAVESGVALYSGYLFKEHTVNVSGFNYGYDAFVLVGFGKSKNLLVSSFMEDGPLLATLEKNQEFYGLGFGVEKEYLPGQLSTFNQRLGKLLMRFSSANHSVNIQFKNDFRSGNLFIGEGTDFGETGFLQLSYSAILNPLEIYHVGVGVSLFTPNPDYSRTPNNQRNSDDGSKNVWHTKPLHGELFYANLYAFGGYQKQSFSGLLKAGLNSQKFGAYIQNTLHDSFGLNPRFPWDVSAKDLLYIQLNGSVLNNMAIDD